MDIEKLQDIINTSNFDALIGQIENEYFDCKGQPYQLDDDSGKRELAKDVSSFANIDGGFIFIGAKTVQSAEHFGDEIKSLRPFLRGLVNTTQYKDVIRAWTYPEVEGIEVKWVEVSKQVGKGLVVITIPKQKDVLKPFLITKTLDGKKNVETFFGYAQRKGDSSKSFSVTDLQKAMRSGLYYEKELKAQLNGMEALLRGAIQGNQQEAQKKTDGERITQRIQKTVEYENLKDNRVIVISAYPSQSSSLKTIFLTTDGSIRRYLESPPSLRHGGWSLETLDQSRIMRGEMIRVSNGERKVVDLYRDGTLIFTALADHRFLAWGKQEKQKINSIAIVEVIYSFTRFYKLVLEDFEQLPKEFTLRIEVKNLHLDGLKSKLAPYAPNSFSQQWDDDNREAPDNDKIIEKVFLTDNYDSEAIAFEMLKEIYLWFGLEEDKIPYQKEEGGVKKIDAEAIRTLR